MPVEPLRQECTFTSKGSYSAIYTLSEKHSSSTAVTLENQATATYNKEVAELNSTMKFEITKLHDFFSRYLKKEFTLNQALAGTATKLNLFVNSLIVFDKLYQLDMKLDTDYLAIQTKNYYQQCKSVEFNHFNYDMNFIFDNIFSCFRDMEQDIKRHTSAKEIPVEARQALQDYFQLMTQFISNGVCRMDIYARPNPGIVNQAEIEQQQNLERAFSLVFSA